PRHGDYLVPAHDQRPRLSLRPGHLGVDEHVLDLLPTPCQMVAWTPPAYLKPLSLGRDAPLAPAHLPVERNRRALEPRSVVLADDLAAAAEVEPGRAGDRGAEREEPRRGG